MKSLLLKHYDLRPLFSANDINILANSRYRLAYLRWMENDTTKILITKWLWSFSKFPVLIRCRRYIVVMSFSSWMSSLHGSIVNSSSMHFYIFKISKINYYSIHLTAIHKHNDLLQFCCDIRCVKFIYDLQATCTCATNMNQSHHVA